MEKVYDHSSQYFESDHSLAGIGRGNKNMNWNYRIIKYREGKGYGLHEVYYEKKNPVWMTVDPIGFVGDPSEGSEGIISSLKMALADAKKHPVLDELEG